MKLRQRRPAVGACPRARSIAGAPPLSVPDSPFPIPRSQRGYTLIEVIVAFAVLALGLTLLLGTLSGATRQVRWSGDASRATLYAQTLLDQMGVGEVLQPGTREGAFEDGRYRWRMDVTPYRDPQAAPAQAGLTTLGAPQLLLLTLSMRWGHDERRERLQLQSLRLVQPDPTQGAVP